MNVADTLGQQHPQYVVDVHHHDEAHHQNAHALARGPRRQLEQRRRPPHQRRAQHRDKGHEKSHHAPENGIWHVEYPQQGTCEHGLHQRHQRLTNDIGIHVVFEGFAQLGQRGFAEGQVAAQAVQEARFLHVQEVEREHHQADNNREIEQTAGQ